MALHDGKRHEAVIEVARPTDADVRIDITVDGKLALAWKGTRDQLKSAASPRAEIQNALTVGIWLAPSACSQPLETTPSQSA